MAFEVLSGIYRTSEGNGTYKSAVCLSFTHEEVWIHGLTTSLSLSCVKEILAYIESTGFKTIKYTRKKNNRAILKIIRLETTKDDITRISHKRTEQ